MTARGLRMIGGILAIGALLGCGGDGADATPVATPAATQTPAEISQCASYYGGRIAEPKVVPADEIVVDPSSIVRFDWVGVPEDSLFAVVDDRLLVPGSTLELSLGRNVVDFLVIGEGEVHYWHVQFTVDGNVAFEHEQNTLEPPHVCDDEMYRYRLVFRLD
jgi:hypothetical protein